MGLEKRDRVGVFKVMCCNKHMIFAGRVPLLVNRCYGGFSLSHDAVNAYNSECNAESQIAVGGREISRTDRLLAAVYSRLQERANGICAKLELYWVEERFEEYLDVCEYDGYESVSVNFEKYKLDMIHKITTMDVSSEEKIDRIQHVFMESEPSIIDDNGNPI